MVSFLNDDSASIDIPIRLVVYIILTAAIVAVTAIGLSHIWPGMTTNIMEKQIGEIKASLGTMQTGGARNLIDPDSPPGNIRTLMVTIPEDVDYLAFGVDPDPDNDLNMTNTPDGMITDRGNVIYYSGTNGKVRIPLEDPIELREGLLEGGRWTVNDIGGLQNGAVLSEKGNYELTFELVYDPISKEKYTLVHLTDNLNAYINPYDPTVLPNNLRVSVNPGSIPADGVTNAQILVKLKDKKGRDATGDGININLSASLGNLSASNLTAVKGKASATISSDLAGTSLITATSPGLNPGSSHLTIKQKPIILEFNQWIFNESYKLSGQFFTNQDLKYDISFTGYGTKVSLPLLGVWWPNASIEIDGIQLGEEIIGSESTITRKFVQVTLPAGYHNLNISLENDKYLPLLGDTNLYVEKVVLSG
ncbi:MAG: invasin domain 3-containing protein [Candidatus Methanoperedens sp.]